MSSHAVTPMSSLDAPLAIFVVSLFDGIGGVLQFLKLLGIQPFASVIVEVDPHARRAGSQNHNVCREYADVCDISESHVQSWALAAKEHVSLVMLSCGFPCVDLSSLKGSQASGLAGSQSSLSGRPSVSIICFAPPLVSVFFSSLRTSPAWMFIAVMLSLMSSLCALGSWMPLMSPGASVPVFIGLTMLMLLSLMICALKMLMA